MKKLIPSAAVSLVALFPYSTSAEIRRDDFRVAVEPGIELAVREVRDSALRADKPPVIILHGARVPGLASFDLPVEGGSLAADLARNGHRVFVIDARGYGGSSRPGEDGGSDRQPLTNSHEVVRDLVAVDAAVTGRTGARQVALLGWATGGH
ncbi:alpha/beta fold hydrolase [Rhizobium leguminosarum]|uniref:alpha/beta fold hydrolase n=1 Tax=Rhizobium leguminosarum TaxID=384 RepID=UPI001C943A6B|nr:alpha/beta fold hydrolase [Rhizobium leguminosarum]